MYIWIVYMYDKVFPSIGILMISWGILAIGLSLLIGMS